MVAVTSTTARVPQGFTSKRSILKEPMANFRFAPGVADAVMPAKTASPNLPPRLSRERSPRTGFAEAIERIEIPLEPTLDRALGILVDRRGMQRQRRDERERCRGDRDARTLEARARR